MRRMGTIMGVALAALAATASRDTLVRANPPKVPRPEYAPEPEPNMRLKANRAMRRRMSHLERGK